MIHSSASTFLYANDLQRPMTNRIDDIRLGDDLLRTLLNICIILTRRLG